MILAIMTDQDSSKRPLGVQVIAWLMIGATVIQAGVMLTLFVRANLSGDAQVGLPLEVLLVLAIGIVPAIGLLRGSPWAWFLVGLFSLATAAGVIVTAYALLATGSLPLPALEANAEVFSSVFMLVNAVLIVIVTGTAFAYFHLRVVRESFELDRPAWQAVLVQSLVVVGLSTAVVMSLPRTDAKGNPIKDSTTQLRDIGEAFGNSDEDLALLLEGLADPGTENRLVAAWSLGRSGRSEAIEPLIGAADKDNSSDVRINAIAALVELNAEGLESALARWLGDDDEQVRSAALRGLARERYAGAAEEVAGLLDHENADVRAQAVDVLGRMGSPGVVPHLVGLSRDPADDVRSRAAFALGKLRHPAAIEGLEVMIGDENWEVRANAAQALGMIGDAAAIPVLEQYRKDPNGMVRDAVAAAVAQIQGG